MKPLFDLTEKVVLVIGGSRGIGLGAAKAFASAGAKVVIANRTYEEGQKAARGISDQGGNAVALPVDVQNSESVNALVSKVLETFSRIDVLVNSAGVQLRKPALEFQESEWDRIININLKGTFLVCQAVGREMVKRRKGKIINLSSVAAHVGLHNRAPYCTAKAGVSMLTRVLALEWAPYGVNVNCVAPGYTRTELLEDLFKKDPNFADTIKQVIPMGRIGETFDLDGVFLLLGSEASDFITGQTLYIDGGFTIPTGKTLFMEGGYTVP